MHFTRILLCLPNHFDVYLSYSLQRDAPVHPAMMTRRHLTMKQFRAKAAVQKAALEPAQVYTNAAGP